MMTPWRYLGLGLFLIHTFDVLDAGLPPPRDAGVAQDSVIMATFLIGTGEGKGQQASVTHLKILHGKHIQRLLLPSYWPEPNLRATPSCKGGWDFFCFNPRILLLRIKLGFCI